MLHSRGEKSSNILDSSVWIFETGTRERFFDELSPNSVSTLHFYRVFGLVSALSFPFTHSLSLSLSLSRKSEKASKLDLRPLINLIIAFFFFCLLSRKKDDQRCLTRFKNPTNRVIVVYTRVSVYSVVLFRPRFEIIRGRWWIDDERWFSFFLLLRQKLEGSWDGL